MFFPPSPCLRRFLLVWAALKHQVGKREYNDHHLPDHLDLSSFLAITSKLQPMVPSPKQAITQHSSSQSCLRFSNLILRSPAPVHTLKEIFKLPKHSFERISLFAQVWRKCC